jgi:hypothetical protein
MLLWLTHAQPPSRPLTASELLGPVAGNALPENGGHEIATPGLAFRPHDSYRELLKTFGANQMILAALDSAKVAEDKAPVVQAHVDR